MQTSTSASTTWENNRSTAIAYTRATAMTTPCSQARRRAHSAVDIGHTLVGPAATLLLRE